VYELDTVAEGGGGQSPQTRVTCELHQVVAANLLQHCSRKCSTGRESDAETDGPNASLPVRERRHTFRLRIPTRQGDKPWQPSRPASSSLVKRASPRTCRPWSLLRRHTGRYFEMYASQEFPGGNKEGLSLRSCSGRLHWTLQPKAFRLFHSGYISKFTGNTTQSFLYTERADVMHKFFFGFSS
jgi:hypothetical protein